jgi:hypothetical protein
MNAIAGSSGDEALQPDITGESAQVRLVISLFARSVLGRDGQIRNSA